MEVVLEKVEIKDKDVLFRLLQYSLFEESATDLNEMNEEAIFEYKWFDNYFYDADRFAYFVKLENKIVGFVMINKYLEKSNPENACSIAEFMVIPKYRRKNIGKKVAIKIFEMFKGGWEVKPSFGSDVAYRFWENVIKEYTNGIYKFEDGIFVFESRKLI